MQFTGGEGRRRDSFADQGGICGRRGNGEGESLWARRRAQALVRGGPERRAARPRDSCRRQLLGHPIAEGRACGRQFPEGEGQREARRSRWPPRVAGVTLDLPGQRQRPASGRWPRRGARARAAVRAVAIHRAALHDGARRIQAERHNLIKRCMRPGPPANFNEGSDGNDKRKGFGGN